jgi:hypothetical protein
MRVIVKQLVYLLASVVGVYLVILAIVLVAFPDEDSDGPMNSARAPSTYFVTEPKYVVLNRRSLATDRPRVIFVGASNTVVGFRQRQVAALLPGVEVDNLGVGGANVTEIAQVIDLALEAEPKAARADDTFVISIWYGEFAQDRVRWYTPDRHPGDTDINIEQYRYALYHRTKDGPALSLPIEDLRFEIAALRPYLLLDELSRRATAGLRSLLFRDKGNRTDAERDSATLSEAEKARDLEYWQSQIQLQGEVSNEQFDVLHAAIGRILASGGKVVLVDLPIPKWHSSRSPFYESYLKRRDALLAELKGTPGFRFVDMGEQDNDLDFSDEVHPKPTIAPRWASTIASALRGQLKVTTEARSDEPVRP